MAYQRISKVIGPSLPEIREVLTKEQVDALKSMSLVALAVIAAVGALGIAIVAPNLFSALKKASYLNKKLGKMTPKQRKEKTIRTFYYLKKRGLIQFKEDRGILKLFLSERGKNKLDKIRFDILSIPKSAKWDGKWWQVASDIPTKDCKQGADLLRKKMKDLKLFPLQKSLWYYPFDPRDEIEFISQKYGVGRFVTVMEINRMDVDDEGKMKEHFKKNGIL